MKLRSSLMVAGTLLSCIAVHYALRERPAYAISRSLSAVQLTTEAEVYRVVSNATAAKRAIMFVHVDWAFMEPQRTQFAEFALLYQRVHPNEVVHFHYVDVTPSHSYDALRSIPGWKQLQGPVGGSLIHGWGEIVLLESGRALHVERIQNFETANALVKLTDKLMPIDIEK